MDFLTLLYDYQECIVLAISFDCSTCVERRKALVEAGIPYPTDYE